MRKFKYVGSEKEASQYCYPKPVRGVIYGEDTYIGGISVEAWAESKPLGIGDEWQEVFEDQQNTTFDTKITSYLDNIKELLISKNRKYGNSALEPVRIFSKSEQSEQILVRIDDKLSRIKNGNLDEDEDVVKDLIGYLVLLEIGKDGR